VRRKPPSGMTCHVVCRHTGSCSLHNQPWQRRQQVALQNCATAHPTRRISSLSLLSEPQIVQEKANSMV